MIPDIQIWRLIKEGELQGIPRWISEMQYSEIVNLVEEQRFSSKTNILDSSYIQFLEEQIALGARGPEWSKTLQKRLDVLKGFVDKSVTTVMIARGDQTVTIRIDPVAMKIFQVEEN